MSLVEIISADRVSVSEDMWYTLRLVAPSRSPVLWGGKELPGSRGRIWRLPTLWSVYLASQHFPNLRLEHPLDRWVLHGVPTPELPQQPIHPNWDKLYPFQQEAVMRLLASNLLLALSPGLGKTATALVAAESYKPNPSVLIVAPKPLLYVWVSEYEKWCVGQSPPFVLESGESPTTDARWVVTNYEQAVKWRKELMARRWDILICDESIKVKNRHALRSQAVADISRSAERIWLLSGNPISRNASDLWQQLNIAFPQRFGRGTWSFWKFAESVCVVRDNVWSGGREIVETKPDVSFPRHFSDVMLVRHQREVLSQLPDIIHEVIPVVLNEGQREAYRQMHREFRVQLSGEELSASTKMVQLLRLQQIASNLINVFPDHDDSAKADAVEELVATSGYEFPMLVWGFFKPGMAALGERLKRLGLKVSVVTGDTPGQADEFEAYKRGRLDVLVLSIGVGKYGHTLINTRTAVYVDRTFDADAYFQSLGRIQRIGLQHRPVVVTLKAVNTVDDLVEANLSGKMRGISQVTNADLLTLIEPLCG